MANQNTTQLFIELLAVVNKLISTVKAQQDKLDELTKAVYEKHVIDPVTEMNVLQLLYKHRTELFETEHAPGVEYDLRSFYNDLMNKYPSVIEYLNNDQNTSQNTDQNTED